MQQMFGDGPLSKILHSPRKFAYSFTCSTFKCFEPSCALAVFGQPLVLSERFRRRSAHAVVGGEGIGGGIPADLRFRHATRWKTRKISQLANATRPPGMVTSMNQPITPSE